LQLKKIVAKIFGFGIGFANAKIMPKKFFILVRDLLICHFGSSAAAPAILAVLLPF
jgi:hypothetical protein